MNIIHLLIKKYVKYRVMTVLLELFKGIIKITWYKLAMTSEHYFRMTLVRNNEVT